MDYLNQQFSVLHDDVMFYVNPKKKKMQMNNKKHQEIEITYFQGQVQKGFKTLFVHEPKKEKIINYIRENYK